MQQALVERDHVIESRTSAVLDHALLVGKPWTRGLGTAPLGRLPPRGTKADAPLRPTLTCGIVGVKPLGAVPTSPAEELDAARSHIALDVAQCLPGGDAYDARQLAMGLPPVGIRFWNVLG
ncbi:hypothetical protein E3O06_11815 [Cryobacterium glaciale]|uniref:Uncharacterized protein n=1 Tax=Cryobacterium glaciale TaxID=1259145 RepID=A0A4R8UTC0_9MICO|nr:hypothetical protein [Cryobacterium glaciale]TFB71525.1 hypothetical protein E3O06_11815 [Cryobacterium glaciale]